MYDDYLSEDVRDDYLDDEPPGIDDDFDYNPYTGQYDNGMEDQHLDGMWEDRNEIEFGGGDW